MTMGEPSLNREARNGVGSTVGASRGQLRRQLPGAGSDAEAMAGESRCHRQPGNVADSADVRHHIRRDIDVTAPLLHDGNLAELRVEANHGLDGLSVHGFYSAWDPALGSASKGLGLSNAQRAARAIRAATARSPAA
jgi:hypothetical protein